MATTNIEINGVIDTSNSVLDNINRIADAALCFVTWNLETGKWSVIVKEPAASGRTFDDSNIIGSISVGGTGLEQTYSSATIRFPHKDLNSDSDYVTVQVDPSELYPNEIENNLTFETDLTNDPVQAQQMAKIELNQSRIDQIIEFATDYSNLGVTAGEIITVNSTQYGYSSKLFRVISVKEIDSEDGMLLLNIIAEEYIDIYTNTLARIDANKKTSITPRAACEEFKEKDAEAITDALTNTPAVARLTNELFAFQTGLIEVPEIIKTSTTDVQFYGSNATDPTVFPNNLLDSGYSFQLPYAGRYLISYYCNFGAYMAQDAPGDAGNYIIPDGCRKQITIWPEINGVKSDPTSFPGSNDKGNDTTTIARKQDLLDDLNVEAIYRFNKGDNLLFKIFAKSDFGQNHPEAAGAPFERAFIIITGRLYYLGDVA